MEYDFYTLGILYLVYSFAGWVGETVVATVRGKHFANRGAAAGPFCFVYGSTAVLLAVGFTDLRSDPVYLFFACTLASTVMEWLTAKLLERLHRRKWWDYSGKRFNLNGYVCLQYSLLWGVLGTASVLWFNGLLLRLCQVIPSWLLHPLVWAAVIVAALDQIGSAVLVGHYAAKHPVLEQLNQRLGESSDGLRRRIALYVEKRIQRAYPAAARQEPTIAQNGETPLSAADLLWLFVVGAFLGDLVETVFCRLTAGVWMSRSSLVWGPFSVVWGLALALTTVLLRQNQDKSDRYRAVVWHGVLGLQQIQIQSGRAHQPAVLLLLGHGGRGVDALRLPGGHEVHDPSAQPGAAVDDRAAGGVHGGEHGHQLAGAGPLRRPHQRGASCQCRGGLSGRPFRQCPHGTHLSQREKSGKGRVKLPDSACFYVRQTV